MFYITHADCTKGWEFSFCTKPNQTLLPINWGRLQRVFFLYIYFIFSYGGIMYHFEINPLTMKPWIQWLQNDPISNHRGKKNLVLSAWGDESLLSEDSINPYYIPSIYQAYSDQTRQNLVWCFSSVHCITVALTMMVTLLVIIDCPTEKVEWRCYRLWSSWRSCSFHWWNISRGCHTGFLTGKFIN